MAKQSLDQLSVYAKSAVYRIAAERLRQDALKAAGRFPFTCADTELSNADKMLVLLEEVGEASKAIMQLERINSAHDKYVNLKTELVQCAAVALAWIECLDRQDDLSMCEELSKGESDGYDPF